jgi:hypothetical protein
MGRSVPSLGRVLRACATAQVVGGSIGGIVTDEQASALRVFH